MPMRRVYLDHWAPTPVDGRVAEAILPFLTEKFGNPSSVHFFGQEARAAVDRARREVAALVSARPNEIVFLSGGTEANNLAIRGIAEQNSERGRHIITTAIEHSSVRGICEALEKRDWEITRLPVYDDGGHQERERRGGTEAVPLIVAFGEAARLARVELGERVEHMRGLRERFESGVEERVSDIVFNGDRARRLPHISNISFRFIEGEGLLINLDVQGVAVSTGSACSSGSLEPSPVIRALGRDDELARGSIRFSLGKDTTDEEVAYVLEALPRAVENLRRLSPLYQKAQAERACAPV